MNGLNSIFQMTPTGVPFRTGAPGESTSEQRYFVPNIYANRSVPLTPQQQADQGMAAQNYSYGSFGEGAPADTNPGWSQMTPTDQAAYYAANPTMAAVTQTGLNALGLTSVGTLQNAIDPIGVAQSHTIAQGIDPSLATPLGPTNTQQVTPIAPVQTANLAAMNQQTQQQQTTSPAAVATAVADTVMGAVQDAEDAEQGAAMNAVSAPTAASAPAQDNAPAPTSSDDGGGPSGNQFAGQENHGTTPSDSGFTTTSQFHDNMMSADDGAENSGVYFKGGRVMNYQSGGLMGMGDSQPRYAYAPIMMASGGLPAAAREVQAQGRNGDSTLVHMTQGEVKGLDAIARAYGGKITINPETGLPEANFLKSILPMVAGAALAATGVGAPMAALLVGGGSYLLNPKQGLMGGLMAGLGAYGGAGLGSALMSAGATAPAVTGTAPGLAQAAATSGSNVGNIAAQQAADSAMNVVAAPSSVVGGTNFAGNLAQAGRGVTALGTEAGRAAAMQSLGGPMGAIKTIGTAAAPMMMGELESPDTANFGGTPTRIRPFKYTRTARPEAFTPASEPGAGSYERRYFDEAYTAQPTTQVLGYAMGGDIEEGLKSGGMRSFDDEYGQDEYAMGGLTAFNSGGLQDGGFVLPADVVAHLGNGSTAAGQKVLAKGLGARPIKGGGDGMSDSIPTTIEGKQPARVADGEAYVPAEKVKEVGPKRLYKMMEKVRQARTNSTRQAPAINAREYIPT